LFNTKPRNGCIARLFLYQASLDTDLNLDPFLVS